MKSRLVRWILEAFFTVVYFWWFFQVIDCLLMGAEITLANILAIPCLFIAFVASVGLAERTVNKIKEHL